MTDQTKSSSSKVELPSVECIQQALASAKSIDDFLAKKAFSRDCLRVRLSV